MALRRAAVTVARRAAIRRAAFSAAPDKLATARERDHIVSDALIAENGNLLEYSVVYTDRALNHMSAPFQQVMLDLHSSLTKAYNCEHLVMLPGSGTYAMEAAARAFGDGEVVVIRNGYFSYRWSQLFDCMGKDPATVHVHMARPTEGWGAPSAPISPPPIAEVVADILLKKPSMVCAPHVETSAGIILPPAYIKQVAAACREVGAIFVLDGIASGTAWVDMGDLGVDAFITAPQKGWSGPAAVGVCMMNDRAKEVAHSKKPTSFTIDLAKWDVVMNAYLSGGHMYHATMPTDAIRKFRDVVHETEDFGLKNCEDAAWKLGFGVRDVMYKRGFKSVAAEGFEAPGVAVVYAPGDPTFAAKFKANDVQIAAGVPLMVGEPADFQTFRIGLFGLDKLANVPKTVANFEKAMDSVLR